MTRRIDVFFYGLFMDDELLRSKGVHALNVRLASVLGFELRIGQRATLLPKQGACSHGVLMELTHREIDQLYSDPSVSAYRAEAVLAALSDGSTVPALCFNLVEPPKPEERNSQYALKLRELGSRLGLPRAYTDKIE